MNTEEWRSIAGYPAYEVSSQGRVRSIDRIDAAGKRRRGKLLGLYLEKSGHLKVSLHQNGRQKSFWVHQLVARAFIGIRPTGLVTMHKDENPSNNRAENLRYGTHLENIRQASESGRFPNQRKTQCPSQHRYTMKNTHIDKTGRRHCRTCDRIRARIRYQNVKRT